MNKRNRFNNNNNKNIKQNNNNNIPSKSKKNIENSIINVIEILKKKYNSPLMLSSFTDKSPFQILIATVLSARSRDDQIIKVIGDLFQHYPDAESMAKAPLKKLEQLVKPSGFYTVKAKNIKQISALLVNEYNGKVPKDIENLLNLPGVGRKTAGCVLVYAFGKGAIPVDTHVQRLSNRLGWVKTKNPDITEKRLMEIVPRKYWTKINELLILHGREVCNPITPKCSICLIYDYCQRISVTRSK